MKTTKNTENKTENKTEKKTKNKIENYLSLARRSGDPHKVGNARDKIFTGGVNGTSFAVLAALAASGKAPDKVGVIYAPVMETGVKNLLDPEKGKKAWEALKEMYATFSPTASFANIGSKLSATVKVYSRDEREHRITEYEGYDLSRIASKEARTIAGFKI